MRFHFGRIHQSALASAATNGKVSESAGRVISVECRPDFGASSIFGRVFVRLIRFYWLAAHLAEEDPGKKVVNEKAPKVQKKEIGYNKSNVLSTIWSIIVPFLVALRCGR